MGGLNFALSGSKLIFLRIPQPIEVSYCAEVQILTMFVQLRIFLIGLFSFQLQTGALSALAVSDNGNFVATGSMFDGTIEIYIAFNLAVSSSRFTNNLGSKLFVSSQFAGDAL